MSERARKGGAKCPICGAATVKRYRPFCSVRCADIDLARWFDGSYSVPVIELDESDVEEFEESWEERAANDREGR